ncbi:MAG: hypothetical protein V1887_03455 [Candidatus Aenigmatarchaeota archaeon]
MRAVLVAVLIVLIALPTLAAAKDILYVTKQSAAGLTCASLTGDDKLFCNRLVKLNYVVSIATDSDVRDDSQLWKIMLERSDMIFLGDVSARMVNTSLGDRDAFCGSLAGSGKKVFATFLNSKKKGDIEGCAFSPLNIAIFTGSSNNCTDNKLFVLESNYITKGLAVASPVVVYTKNNELKVSGGTGNAAVNCNPSGLGTDFYSAIEVNGKGVFWGLDSPGNFTDAAWRLFDRTVLFANGDNGWNVTAFFIPQKATVNGSVMVFARVSNVSGPVTTGTVKAFIGETELGNLSYSNGTGWWENRRLILPNGGDLQVRAEDGDATSGIEAGSMEISIISGNYQPPNYTVSARPLLNGQVIAANLNYRIWNTNLTVLKEGSLECGADFCTATTELQASGQLILEVYGASDTHTGGSFKLINKQGTAAGARAEPSQWIVTATSPGSERRTFNIVADSNLTGMALLPGGGLAASIVNFSSIPATLTVGSSTSFSAMLDWNALVEGEYSGSIILVNDQKVLTIPVTLYRYNIIGDYLGSKQKSLSLNVPAGGKGTTVLTLTDSAGVPATSFFISADTPELARAVSISNDLMAVPAGGQADLTIKVDAGSLGEGSFSGNLIVWSSLGNETVPISVRVGQDISALLRSLNSDYTELIEGRKLSSDQQSLSNSVNSSLSAANTAIAGGDYSAAMSAYRSANSTYFSLKDNIAAQSAGGDYTVIIIAVLILVLIGGGIAYLYLTGKLPFLKKKKTEAEEEQQKEEEQAEMPGEENETDEKYRFEYY